MHLQIQNLQKTYPNGVQALTDISLDIQKGMFGLLGPNGAGKSTLMRTIATLQDPDKGVIRFNDIDVLNNKIALRKTLGYLPQEFGVYPRISAERLLNYLAQLKGIASKADRTKLVDYCLAITNLTSVKKKSVSSFSGGMKQRFGIAQMLLNNPQLIIVDEPTAGLDPTERQRFLNILRDISTKAVVIFSTHIVDDIKELCLDMAILHKGRVLLHSTPEKAIKNIEGKVFASSIDREQLEIYERRYRVLSSSYNRDHSLSLRIFSNEKPADPVFKLAQPDLEDVYFNALQS